MKTWFRWILLVLTIGGGFAGLAVTVQAAFEQGASGFFAYLFYVIAIALYVFVIVSGLLFAENPRRLVPLRVAFALQIPWVSSPLIVYDFCAGCRINGGLDSFGRLIGSFRFGSDFELFILGHHPWYIGINVFALLILVLLAVYGRTPNTSLEPTATAPTAPTVSTMRENLKAMIAGEATRQWPWLSLRR